MNEPNINDQLFQLKQTIMFLKSEITRYQHELQNNHYYSINLELENENTELLQQKKDLSLQLLKLHRNSNRNEENYKTEIENLKEQKIKLISSIQKLLQQKQDLRTENVQLTKEKENLRNENLLLTNEKESLISENVSLTKEKENLINKNATLTNEKESLLNKNAALANERENLRSENATLINEKENLINENAALTKEKESLLNKNVILVNEKENLRSENTTLINEKENLISENAALNNEKENLLSINADLMEKTQQPGSPIEPNLPAKKYEKTISEFTNKIERQIQKLQEEFKLSQTNYNIHIIGKIEKESIEVKELLHTLKESKPQYPKISNDENTVLTNLDNQLNLIHSKAIDFEKKLEEKIQLLHNMEHQLDELINDMEKQQENT